MRGGFCRPPGRSRGLQGPPGLQDLQRPPGGLFQGPTKARKMRPPYRQSREPWARLKFHAGWSGWTRPPIMAGGGGVLRSGQGSGVSARGSRGGF